ncbi:hypothetical protein P5W99_36680 [Paraburkholderia sp. A3BS-1L]|uniref:hypothetical protein n=1 Tax=Paraburkholderia sp. A3BS-1L TaxID=3028375 RepID=UPI003DA7B177
MKSRMDSLHGIVDKWFGQAGVHASVVRERAGAQRCVRIDVARGIETLSMRFFRHADGSWQVIPPARLGPCMGIQVRRT